MPPSIRFVIIPLVLLVAALIETEAPGNRSANCPICAPHPITHFGKLSRPDVSQASYTRSVNEAPQTGQLQFLHKLCSPKSHRRQPVDRSITTYLGPERFSAIPPAAAGGSFSPNLGFSSLDAQAGIERSTGCRRWDSRAFLAPCRPGLNGPPAAAGGIHIDRTYIETLAPQFALRSPMTRRYEDSRVSMGCLYAVVVYGSDLARLREAAAAALDEVDRIDRLMSNYKNDSELTRVNLEAAKAPVKADPELFDFIAECLRYSRESEGAFDITVGPLMKAWGFFRGEGRMPSEAELAEARGRVGYRRVILNQKDGTIFFDRSGVELDLGGIAKGYAVDRAVAVLKRYGVMSALLSAGGSTIYALGSPPGKPAWEIEVQDPVERDKIATRVRLKDRALSVSGSYEKFFELNGARYSHVMDPRTGRPVQGVLSVADIADDRTRGDCLDT